MRTTTQRFPVCLKCRGLTDGRVCLRCGARLAAPRRGTLLLGVGAGVLIGSVVTAMAWPQPQVIAPPTVVISTPPAPLPVEDDALPSLPPAPRPRPVAPRLPAVGKFACATRPLGATVWIDGQLMPLHTPISLVQAVTLTAGRHDVVFELHGKRSGPHKIFVEADQVTKLTGVELW